MKAPEQEPRVERPHLEENALIQMALHDIEDKRGSMRESVMVFREFYRSMKALADAHGEGIMAVQETRVGDPDWDDLGPTCEACRGTGQPNGIKGGPEHGQCSYCGGRGRNFAAHTHLEQEPRVGELDAAAAPVQEG